MKILLTGCSRGLGREILDLLLKANCEAWGVSRQAPANLQSPKFHHLSWDLLNLDGLKENLEKEFAHRNFDAVIHNAGLGLGKLSLDANEDDRKILFNLHSEAPLLISNFLIKRALAAGKPLRIVQVSTIAVHVPFRGLGTYSASKASLEAMGRAYAKEWGRFGIDVLSVCPDYMDTDMTAPIAAATRDAILAGSPDQKPLSTTTVAEFIANAILQKNSDWNGKSVVLSNRSALKKQIMCAEWV